MRAAAVALGLGLLASCNAPVPGPGAASASDPGGTCRVVHVVDGDTVDMRCAGSAVFRARLTGFDTPEIFSPRCGAEKSLGLTARSRLIRLVHDATRVDADLGGLDIYDRRLVRLSLDGKDVAATLISEGLAVRYNGGRRIDWCRRLG